MLEILDLELRKERFEKIKIRSSIEVAQLLELLYGSKNNCMEGKGCILGATLTVVIFRHGYLCSPLQFYNHKSSPKRLSVIELFISPG